MNAECEFVVVATVDADRERVKCAACGQTATRRIGSTLRAVCRVPWTCAHQGGQSRELKIRACGGQYKTLPVYTCAVHGECAMIRCTSATRRRKSRSGRAKVHGCIGCTERVGVSQTHAHSSDRPASCG